MQILFKHKQGLSYSNLSLVFVFELAYTVFVDSEGIHMEQMIIQAKRLYSTENVEAFEALIDKIEASLYGDNEAEAMETERLVRKYKLNW